MTFFFLCYGTLAENPFFIQPELLVACFLLVGYALNFIEFYRKSFYVRI